ncbi:MAG: hypothetical protein ACK5MA_07675 [Parachlamydiaceae bacterium]
MPRPVGENPQPVPLPGVERRGDVKESHLRRFINRLESFGHKIHLRLKALKVRILHRTPDSVQTAQTRNASLVESAAHSYFEQSDGDRKLEKAHDIRARLQARWDATHQDLEKSTVLWLETKGYRINALPNDYIAQPPQDFSAVLNNLDILREVERVASPAFANDQAIAAHARFQSTVAQTKAALASLLKCGPNEDLRIAFEKRNLDEETKKEVEEILKDLETYDALKLQDEREAGGVRGEPVNLPGFYGIVLGIVARQVNEMSTALEHWAQAPELQLVLVDRALSRVEIGKSSEVEFNANVFVAKKEISKKGRIRKAFHRHPELEVQGASGEKKKLNMDKEPSVPAKASLEELSGYRQQVFEAYQHAFEMAGGSSEGPIQVEVPLISCGRHVQDIEDAEVRKRWPELVKEAYMEAARAFTHANGNVQVYLVVTE